MNDEIIFTQRPTPDAHKLCLEIQGVQRINDTIQKFKNRGNSDWESLVLTTEHLGLKTVERTVAILTVANWSLEVLDTVTDECDPYVAVEIYKEKRKNKFRMPYSSVERFDSEYGVDWIELEFKNAGKEIPEYLLPAMKKVRELYSQYKPGETNWDLWFEIDKSWQMLCGTLLNQQYFYVQESIEARPEPESLKIFGRMERSFHFCNGACSVFTRFLHFCKNIPITLFAKSIYAEALVTQIDFCGPEMRKTNQDLAEAGKTKLWNMLISQGFVQGEPSVSLHPIWPERSQQFSDDDLLRQYEMLAVPPIEGAKGVG